MNDRIQTKLLKINEIEKNGLYYSFQEVSNLINQIRLFDLFSIDMQSNRSKAMSHSLESLDIIYENGFFLIATLRLMSPTIITLYENNDISFKGIIEGTIIGNKAIDLKLKSIDMVNNIS